MAAPAHIARENGKKGGRPLGRKNLATIEKELELQYIKERVSKAKEKLLDAQISLAQGVSFLYRIDKDAKGKDKKPELVTSQWEIEQYLSGETDADSYYYITTQKPENNAIDSLLDRTVGKPKDPESTQEKSTNNYTFIFNAETQQEIRKVEAIIKQKLLSHEPKAEN